MTNSQQIRILPVTSNGRTYIDVQVNGQAGQWRTVLSNCAEYKFRPWEKETACSIEDLEIKPATDDDHPFFTASRTGVNGDLILTGSSGNHQVEQTVSHRNSNHLSFTVKDTITTSGTPLSRMMSHFYFVPDGRSMGYALPLDFAWLPGLHGNETHVAGDWFFRSPAAIVLSHGLYAAIIPDLNALQRHPSLRHALDLRSWHHGGSGETYGLPRLSYGFCSWQADGHVFTAADDTCVSLESGTYSYGFDLLVGEAEGPESVVAEVTDFLWRTYGRKHLDDIRPQVLPFEEYGRQYTYPNELEQWVAPVEHNGVTLYGFNNVWRHGANFHAWENDLHTGFGVYHYGCKHKNGRLESIGAGMLGLALSAPENHGAFPSVYNFEKAAWEGSMYWTSWPAYPHDGYDLQGMGVTAWWMLYWRDYFPNLTTEDQLAERLSALCEFLMAAQQDSGAIPTYYDHELNPAPQLREAAPTAIGGAVLAKVALATGDSRLEQASLEAGRFLLRDVIPHSRFFDFELFYSCAPKPLHWVDPVCGIPPMNTLAIQWAADHFLALYKLTEDTQWLQQGEFCISLLSLFQQVWAPNRFGAAYMFGGFGVMNCDGEWNDGRQSRVVPTYADYYDVTGKIEYLERAVAACRASFAAMDMTENHANGINDYAINQAETVSVEVGQGYSPESIMHGAPQVLTGAGAGWTGFNWGPGGGLGASAMLERRYGAAWVDGSAKKVVPVDGVKAIINQWDPDLIDITIACALRDLAYPYSGNREIKVRFGRFDGPIPSFRINGAITESDATSSLRDGIEIQV